jgi:hypothetical protein
MELKIGFFCETEKRENGEGKKKERKDVKLDSREREKKGILIKRNFSFFSFQPGINSTFLRAPSSSPPTFNARLPPPSLSLRQK